MILKGRLAELLVNIYPNLYSKYDVLENGVRVLYEKLQRDLYGFLTSALLSYLKLATYLNNNGFIINSHHPCLRGKQ